MHHCKVHKLSILSDQIPRQEVEVEEEEEVKIQVQEDEDSWKGA